MLERLQKIIASAGIASRRKAEELITDGKVTVNGAVVTELGTKADADHDKIVVLGRQIEFSRSIIYALDKPIDVVSTASDPDGRKTVLDFVPKEPRVYPVGRLDRMTEGLIILTNNGDLAFKLAHPSFEHSKEYEVVGVSNSPIDVMTQKLTQGAMLKDGFIKPDKVDFLGVRKGRLVYKITVHEGRSHLIRRLCGKVGLEIIRLIRTKIGPIALGDLEPGKYRVLAPEDFKD